MPAGAISMFGPGTKSLLSEGLKKRHLSTSEESEKSEEVWKDHLLKITTICVGQKTSVIWLTRSDGYRCFYVFVLIISGVQIYEW